MKPPATRGIYLLRARTCADKRTLIAKLNSNGAAAMSISHIVEQIESTAEWRRMTAEEFPDDHRNLEAAGELDRLAKEINDLAGSDMDRRFEALDAIIEKNRLDDSGLRMTEWLSEELRAIGFRRSYEDGAEFLKSYYGEFEEEVRRVINEDDNDIESPRLEEQIENDPAVKAAKQAYEEARAKAYAEARKRL
jgi:hypothetical protein